MVKEELKFWKARLHAALQHGWPSKRQQQKPSKVRSPSRHSRVRHGLTIIINAQRLHQYCLIRNTTIECVRQIDAIQNVYSPRESCRCSRFAMSCVYPVRSSIRGIMLCKRNKRKTYKRFVINSCIDWRNQEKLRSTWQINAWRQTTKKTLPEQCSP